MLGEAFPQLIQDARDGVESAFEQLWRDVNPTLVNYLRMLVHDGADDVAAETWLSIVTGLSRFDGDEQAWRSWVFTIARRRAVDEARRSSRRPLVHVEPRVLVDAGPHAPDSADEALANLGTHAALDLVRTLPALQSEVVMLRFVAGLSNDDVARIVGRSQGAVRVAAHRGLKALAAAVAAEEVTQ